MSDDTQPVVEKEVNEEPAAPAKPKKQAKAKQPVFDPEQPFGRVYAAPGRVYFQDGHYFDGKGNLAKPVE